MTNQKVYIVGPLDLRLKEMWDSEPGFQLTPFPKQSDILCFQGGEDIQPALYGEEPIEGTYCNPIRDTEDTAYWENYSGRKKVGICRGGQFLNVMSGGEMWQDVNNHMGSHEVTNLLDIPGSSFGHGTLIRVSSDHHQMMIPHPDYSEVLAFADEATEFKSGTVDRKKPSLDAEVIWYEHTNSLCFQPHPEYQYSIHTKQYFFDLVRYLMG